MKALLLTTLLVFSVTGCADSPVTPEYREGVEIEIVWEEPMLDLGGGDGDPPCGNRCQSVMWRWGFDPCDHGFHNDGTGWRGKRPPVRDVFGEGGGGGMYMGGALPPQIVSQGLGGIGGRMQR